MSLGLECVHRHFLPLRGPRSPQLVSEMVRETRCGAVYGLQRCAVASEDALQANIAALQQELHRVTSTGERTSVTDTNREFSS